MRMKRLYSGVALFSATVLTFQVALTRLFSVAQFYHFAFLVISLALLGFGASGSLLAICPRLRAPAWRPVFALATGPAMLAAYLVLNRWAFDSYAIAWDRAQLWRLLGNLLSLAIPFTLAGALIGALLGDPALSPGRIYGANMIGSAGGAAVAPLLLARLGDERILLLTAALAAFAGLILVIGQARHALSARLTGAGIVIVTLGLLSAPPALFSIEPSPYKALSHFRRNPDATLAAPRTNAYSRLDIVRSPSIHVAPGLSMTYLSGPPPEIGLLIDGDNLLPVVQASAAPTAFAQAMPAAVPLGLFEQPDVLILGAGGGLDAWIALNNGARSVVAVEGNSLVVEALRGTLREWAGLAGDPRVRLLHQEIRAYARQSRERFDVVQLALTDAYRPVTSGAFTLTENYALTVEAFRDYLNLLRPQGVFVVTRWLQTPPSEEVRTLGLILAALDPLTADPAQHVIAFRSFQTITFLVKRVPFSPAEVAQILDATERLQYDMVLAPDLPPERINRYARLPEPIYHQTLSELLQANDRAAFYDAYDFEVRPPTDDRPFFFHFFKWRQTPDILNNLGRTWQPFGGSGYFVLVALLIFATLAAALFVVLPVALARRFRQALRVAGGRTRRRVVIYFAGLGLAYLFIEVATLQQFVLILGQPTLAMATVLATLLLASGIGSALSDRLPWGAGMIALTALAALWPRLIPAVFSGVLGLDLGVRWTLCVLALLPLGFLMGIPFARGLSAIRPAADLLPWAWAINGGASVISGVLAPLLALSAGFSWVLWAGAALYGLAWLTRPALTRG
ncbi:MAG: hypothetical protein KatS3mg051_1233 [Anaerolineae bacterium]|nr:MAG: hypothetical protein KatS3mg051_1233 [Anaerolineae bacterium]